MRIEFDDATEGSVSLINTTPHHTNQQKSHRKHRALKPVGPRKKKAHAAQYKNTGQPHTSCHGERNRQ